MPQLLKREGDSLYQLFTKAQILSLSQLYSFC